MNIRFFLKIKELKVKDILSIKIFIKVWLKINATLLKLKKIEMIKYEKY